MRVQVGWKYFLIPVIYTGVILSLFYLQFADRIVLPRTAIVEKADAETEKKPARTPTAPQQTKVRETPVKPAAEKPAAKPVPKPSGKAFSDSVSGFTLKGTAAQGSDRQTGVTELQISGLGVSFMFSPAEALTCTTPDGKTIEPALRGYRKNQGKLELFFEDDMKLLFTFQGGGAGFSIEPIPPKSLAPLVSVSFSADTAAKAKADFSDGIPAARVSFGGNSYFLTAPMGSKFLPAEKKILLVSVAGQGLVLEKTATPDQNAATYWYSKNGSSVTEEDYRRSVDGFMKKAYAGWKTGRYNPSQKSWKMPDGSFAYSEAAAVAYLSETVTRGDIASAVTEMTAAAKLRPEQSGFGSNPFLGDLMKSAARQKTQDDALAARVRALIARKDPSLFADRDLLTYITARAPASIRKEFLKAAGEVNFREADYASVLGMVSVSLSPEQFTGLETQSLNRFSGILNDRIVPNLVRSADSLFLQESPGKANALRSLAAGRLLMLSGKKNSDSYHQSLGRHLVVSVLSLADRDGFIPETIIINEKGAPGKEGLTASEQAYAWLGERSYAPRRISLPQIGSDAWIWTIAGFSVEQVTGGFKLTFAYPVGQTHNVTISGLKPFREIYLYSTKWRSTNLFQDYAYGCYYDPNSQTLYMKLKNKVEKEEVYIYYSAPSGIQTGKPAPAAQAAAPAVSTNGTSVPQAEPQQTAPTE